MKHKARLSPARRARLSPAERLDIAAIERLAPVIESPLGRLFGRFGELAGGAPSLAASTLVIAAGVARRDSRMARTGLRMISAHLAAMAIKAYAKGTVTRTRPDALLREGTYRMESGGVAVHDLRSFPSGHTARAVALAAAASREYAAARTLYGAAAIMAIAQIFRRAHFPGDVLAGAIVGLAGEAASRRLLGPLFRF